MRSIAIIGAGQTALLAAHALHQQGYEVRLYSDKSPADFLTRARPTGAAFRAKMTLDFERELGLEHWGETAPRSDGVHLTFCPKQGSQLLTLLGRFNEYGLAIDVRLQSATWMREFEQRGGRIEIRDVSIRELDEIAAEHDLTIVAAGGHGAPLAPSGQRLDRFRARHRSPKLDCRRMAAVLPRRAVSQNVSGFTGSVARYRDEGFDGRS